MARALFIIDVQNDFTEGGALAVEGGAAVASDLTDFLEGYAAEYDYIFASRDWHDDDSDNGGHFSEDPDFIDTWPVHCVAGSAGAQYHPDLDIGKVTFHVKKGQGEPAYSIFEGMTDDNSSVSELLADLEIDEVDIAGLATDYCVRASALDALDEGVSVRILVDLVAGVGAESSALALAEIVDAGGELVNSSDF